MNENLRRIAPGVLFAGVIVFVLGLVVLVSTMIWGTGRGPVPTEWMLLGGVVLMLVAAVLNPDPVRRLFGVRSVRAGSNALVVSLAFIGILGLVNYLGTQKQFNWRQDFTSNKQFTLSPQTLQVLESLKKPVKAYVFTGLDPTTGQEQPYNKKEILDRLNEYALRSPNFSYEQADPYGAQGAVLADQFEMRLPYSVIMTAGGKHQETSGTGESDFTGAILKVTTDVTRTVYFLAGHKERDPNDASVAGYSSLRAALERENYTVSNFSFLVTDTVPFSATVLVMAGPATALGDAEAAALDAYVRSGGRLMLLIDPQKPNPAPALLAAWGVELRNDEVLDQQFVQGANPLYPLVVRYPNHAITKKFTGLPSVIPMVRSLKRSETYTGTATIESVIQSSPQSWGETNLDFQASPPQFDNGKDTMGPLDLGLAIESSGADLAPGAKKSRIVVFGTSEFASNRMLQANQFVNGDLFLNAVSWLAEEEALISIRPSLSDTRQITINDQQWWLVLVSLVCLMPGLVALAGFSIWWRRR
ncbi:MAG: GldG family protein [Chloroflexi bacterium]|nr:GldG family protein [Chloroflexota bacterium]